jgi:hypothetical protein
MMQAKFFRPGSCPGFDQLTATVRWRNRLGRLPLSEALAALAVGGKAEAMHYLANRAERADRRQELPQSGRIRRRH